MQMCCYLWQPKQMLEIGNSRLWQTRLDDISLAKIALTMRMVLHAGGVFSMQQ